MPTRIVVADDHPLVLDGLSNLFKLQKDFKVVACCPTGEATVEAVRRYHPDVLVLDAHMPGMDGFAVIQELQGDKIKPGVLLITADIDENEVVQAVRLGVKGIILKASEPAAFVGSVRRIGAGEKWFDNNVLDSAIESLAASDSIPSWNSAGLSPRENEILGKIGSGMRNRQIAEELGISEGTVKVHLRRIYDKLGIDSRLKLLLYTQRKRVH